LPRTSRFPPIPIPTTNRNHPLNAPDTKTTTPNLKLGLATAIGAQVLWGVFPAYIKLFQGVIHPLDLVAHRAVWSFTTLVLWLVVTSAARPAIGSSTLLQRLFGDSKTIRTAIFATVMIGINWLTFVWAVSNDHALDASLGYYICPQLVVLLGVVFLRERLTNLQWTAVVLATIGVSIMTFSAQSEIWIGLLVAVAFALYALIKKKTELSAVEGLTMETGFMFLPAIAFLLWRFAIDGGTIIPDSILLTLALLCSGVLTIAPLILYAISVKHIKLSTVGLLQFVGPTIQFILGVFAFAEPVDATRFYGFVFVWLGVSVYLFALHRRSRLSSTQ
jgi:chloramphenicol-sensitive protein RarD